MEKISKSLAELVQDEILESERLKRVAAEEEIEAVKLRELAEAAEQETVYTEKLRTTYYNVDKHILEISNALKNLAETHGNATEQLSDVKLQQDSLIAARSTLDEIFLVPEDLSPEELAQKLAIRNFLNAQGIRSTDELLASDSKFASSSDVNKVRELEAASAGKGQVLRKAVAPLKDAKDEAAALLEKHDSDPALGNSLKYESLLVRLNTTLEKLTLLKEETLLEIRKRPDLQKEILTSELEKTHVNKSERIFDSIRVERSGRVYHFDSVNLGNKLDEIKLVTPDDIALGAKFADVAGESVAQEALGEIYSKQLDLEIKPEDLRKLETFLVELKKVSITHPSLQILLIHGVYKILSNDRMEKLTETSYEVSNILMNNMRDKDFRGGTTPKASLTVNQIEDLYNDKMGSLENVKDSIKLHLKEAIDKQWNKASLDQHLEAHDIEALQKKFPLLQTEVKTELEAITTFKKVINQALFEPFNFRLNTIITVTVDSNGKYLLTFPDKSTAQVKLDEYKHQSVEKNQELVNIKDQIVLKTNQLSRHRTFLGFGKTQKESLESEISALDFKRRVLEGDLYQVGHEKSSWDSALKCYSIAEKLFNQLNNGDSNILALLELIPLGTMSIGQFSTQLGDSLNSTSEVTLKRSKVPPEQLLPEGEREVYQRYKELVQRSKIEPDELQQLFNRRKNKPNAN